MAVARGTSSPALLLDRKTRRWHLAASMPFSPSTILPRSGQRRASFLARLILPGLLFLLLPENAAPQQSKTAEPSEPIPVRSFIDKESAGWALKINDEAFVAEQGGCRVQWNAVEDKPLPGEAQPRRYLSAKRCGFSFQDQLPLHRAILMAIDSKWKLSSFRSVGWGSFQNGEDVSWNLPIATASAKSREYRDYRLHYPNSRLNLNAFFVEEANTLNVYAPLKNLFGEFGIELKLDGVEKVFTPKAEKLPVQQELRELGIAGGERVVWDVGSSWFRMKKAE
jgi:hypothetical protein